MAYNRDRAGEFALALMYLTLHDGARVWKGYAWDVLDHLFDRGWITDPKSRAKSVLLTDDGRARAEALFVAHLAAAAPDLTTTTEGRGRRSAESTPSTSPSPGPGLPPELGWSTLPAAEEACARRLLAPLCGAAADPTVAAKLQYAFRFEGPAVLLLERRPHFEPPQDWRESGVAKFRYVKSRAVWQLFCQHRDLRWHVYAPLPEAADLARLVAEVRADPTGIFWG